MWRNSMKKKKTTMRKKPMAQKRKVTKKAQRKIRGGAERKVIIPPGSVKADSYVEIIPPSFYIDPDSGARIYVPGTWTRYYGAMGRC